MIARDIVDAADISPADDVLEVGPGKGALTEDLLGRAAHVTSVELDEDLATSLRRRFAGESRLTVVAANVLDHRPDELLSEGGRTGAYKVVANLPYYITAPIMRHFLERGPRPEAMVVMVQREVAENIAGVGGSMTLLGVSVQVFGSAKLLFRVPPRAFTPPPRVDSAIVRVNVYPVPLVPVPELEGFFRLVRAGFRGPRKQLHNALGSGLWLPPGAASPLIASAGIDPERRPGTLSVDDWYRLYAAYERARPAFAAHQAAHATDDDLDPVSDPV
jgi:16S rRNA (adenine1518-N6/adenine1519-N6)-dimethyltransferase